MSNFARRRVLIGTASLLAAPWATRAQQGDRVYRIGYLSVASPSGRPPRFVLGLRELGYKDGQNVLIEMRYAEGQEERLRGLADELIRTKPDLLVGASTDATSALMKATSTIPIVFVASSNPIGYGLVTNLARPGGNVTGFSRADGEGLHAKMLQLLKQAAPKLSHAALLHTYNPTKEAARVKDLQMAAQVLKLRLDAYQAESASAFEGALAAIGNIVGPSPGAGGVRGLVVTGSPYFDNRRDRLVQLAADKRLPAIYYGASWADAGGLMSYGPNTSEVGRQVASYIDKIFKGAKPGDLPVVQPTQFDLVINLKTARTLGLEIPRSLLIAASRVIE
jgi:putative ABC transport system substrate-binding protein